MTRWGREAERERNDNPFDGHNAARHRKAHQTRNTANRPPLVSLSSLASPRLASSLYPCAHLSPRLTPSPSLENLEAANLPPVICKPPPPSPRASHKLTELYYADPLVPLCPPISLPPPPPPSSYKSTIFPLAYKPLQLAGIFVSLFSPPSSRLELLLFFLLFFFEIMEEGRFERGDWFRYSRIYFKGASILSNRKLPISRILNNRGKRDFS